MNLPLFAIMGLCLVVLLLWVLVIRPLLQSYKDKNGS